MTCLILLPHVPALWMTRQILGTESHHSRSYFLELSKVYFGKQDEKLKKELYFFFFYTLFLLIGPVMLSGSLPL